MITNTHLWLYCAQFFSEWKIFQLRCRENQNIHFRFINFFSSITSFIRQWGKIWHSRTGHKWQNGTCTMHSGYLSYRHTLWICNTYCFSTATMVARTLFYCNNACKNTFLLQQWLQEHFSTATMVARTRLKVTLYIHCLPGST